jgi:hypothetical protein
MIRAFVLAVGIAASLACATAVKQQDPAMAGGQPPPQQEPAADCQTQCKNLVSCGSIGSGEYRTCVDACYAGDYNYMGSRREGCKR